MLSQKDAVYQATLEILDQAKIPMDGRPVSEVMPKELRKLVTDKLFEMVKQGKVAFKATASNSMKMKDTSRMSAYVSGLISNHWKRDPRLNGKENA
jgi:hypothetical protein